MFEDSDIIYKIIDKCKNIAISDKQMYFYRVNPESITRSGYDERKLALVPISENMCEFILARYPDLENAASRRMVWALFSTLNQLYKSDCIDRNVEQIILNKIKQYEMSVIKDKRASITDKCGIILRKFGRRFYIFSWSLYCKLFKS